ncbi:flagellin [Pseudoalteromonas sp. DL-6]|uniref:flagellin n=1 Tax=Pseudoalteromonas sp. DL-6 TaxID=1390185 RepID=UPI001038F485|nr:flagellin [Pseudoalteromonas sp. DL-6]QBJ62317.1 flagellin [Pseudoalteromonas sp. DL-6]
MLVKSSEKAQAIDLVNTNKSDALVTSSKDSANNLWKNKIVAREDQVKVLTGWAQRGALSQALAKAEQSESTIRNLYMGLEKLAQQLNTQAANTQPQPMQQQQIKVQIASLQNTANKKGSGLDTQLKITDPNRAISKQLNVNIDLLSARPHEENIQLVMGRSGKSLSLKLPAYQDEKTNLTAIQNAFAPHHINVEINRENRLLFSAQKDNAGPLLEPWVMSGQGVRVAAGNPISLQLNDLDNPLKELAKIADKNATIAQYREQIQATQRHLKANLIKIQAQKQQLQSQLEQLDSASSLGNTDELLALSLGVKQHMQNPGVNSVAAIMSQANITRNMVQYSLT